MLKKLKKTVFRGIVLLGGLLLLVLIFQFRPIQGEQKDVIAVDSFKTFDDKQDIFKSNMETLKKEKEEDENVAGFSFDVSNCKLCDKYTEDEKKAWLKTLEIASVFYNEKTVGYKTNGLPCIAAAAAETGEEPNGKTPVNVIPREMGKSLGTITSDIMCKTGVQDYLKLGCSFGGADVGTPGILQCTWGYVDVVLPDKATGAELDKIKANNLVEKAKAVKVKPVSIRGDTHTGDTLYDDAIRMKDAGAKNDRFNWPDSCNNYAASAKSVITALKKMKNIKLDNQYQYYFYIGMYHNLPAFTYNVEDVKVSYPWCKYGFTDKKQVYDMGAQLSNPELINKMKALAKAEVVNYHKTHKTLIHSDWTKMVELWTSQGFKMPEGVNQKSSNVVYGLDCVYNLMLLECYYSGV